VGSRIAAGIYNQGIKEQHRLVCFSTLAKCVKSTLEVLKPSLTHLFGNDDSRINKALEAAKFLLGQQPYRPKALFFRSSDTQEGQNLGSLSPTLGRRSPPTSPGPREKAPALPPGRGRASRRSDSY
jgi:hypothetical protein